MNSPAATKTIYITANSPGEIAGWAIPVVDALKAKDPSVRITLVITPCQYASGREAEVAAAHPGVDRIVRIWPLMREIILGRHRAGPGSLVLFLGGDMFYALWLARRLRIPAWAYTSSPRRGNQFSRYLVADNATRSRFIDKGIAPESIEVVGQLSLDSIRVSGSRDEIVARLDGEDIATFLPGSRPAEIRHMVPFFAEAAELLSRRHPGLRMYYAVSPFVDGKLLDRAVEQGNCRRGGDDIVTPGGLRIRLVTRDQHDIMSVSKLVIAVPGTNNLQVAAMGVPMLIVTPLNWAEDIPMDGLLGLLNPKVPPFGWLKRKIILSWLPHTEYVSLPNKLASRHLVPELLGILAPDQVADRASELLDQPERTAEICREIREIIGEPGAAERMASALLGDETSSGSKRA